jgi:hypothetical protein
MTWVEAAPHWALAIIAALAALVGYRQLQMSTRYELLKMLEQPHVRDARRLLYQKLRAQTPESRWWENKDNKDNDELERAASTVCSSFDIIGLMARGSNRRFFRRYWAYPICWTYKALEQYLDARNPTGYVGYRRLYKEASDL